MEEKIKIGVSACLLGHEVRYNGGHSRDRLITDTLSQYLEFVPVCPEVEAGYPTPRETFRLIGDPEDPTLITTKEMADHTPVMKGWALKRVIELEKEELCGFIFKKNSPSSGLHRVKLYNEKGQTTGLKTRGIFARAFTDHFPLLPVEEDGRLHDPKLRENFIESIFVMKRWRESLTPEPDRRAFIDFHTRHKLLIRSHSPKHHNEMGKLVANIKSYSMGDFAQEYQTMLMEALRLKTTPKKNTDTLNHIMGYFKRDLSKDEKQEILEIIENYRQGHIPLIVPVTLMRHFVRKYDQEYLKDQWYLNPHPLELQLRNHA
jgi:uncharacterized protein YbgA (DUF1722 family)/uncharacterized protein YbbK (DUF523 family)